MTKPVASETSASSRVLSVLKTIDRRVLLSYCTDMSAKIICAAFGMSIFFHILELLFPFRGPSLQVLTVGSLAGFLGLTLRKLCKTNRLNRAAGMADRVGGLKDEIKTAYWFMRNPGESAWRDLQLKGAARSLTGLHISQLFPLKISKWFGGVFFLLAVDIAIMNIPNESPLFLSGIQSETFFSAIENQVSDLEDMLESDVAALLEETDLESLEEVLEALRSDEFDSEDVLRELQETEELLNQESFEIDALNQELTHLANEFSETSELSAFSNSLEEMDFAAAADRLRELSKSLSSMDASSRNELEEELRLEDFSESLSVEELLEALENAGAALAEDQMPMAEGSLSEAASTLDAMAQSQSLGEALHEAAMNMQALSQEISQSANTSSMSPEGEMPGGSTGMGSDEVTQSSGGESGDGSGPAGNSTGLPSENSELELGVATTLEVLLNLEIIEERFAEDEPDPNNLFQGASQRQQSELQFQDVGNLTEYSSTSALDVETVVWQYRKLVKDYFLGIRPQRENDNRNR